MRKAATLVEGLRYRYGTRKFLYLFIDTWMFRQTGLYAPLEAIPAEFESDAAELSHVLGAAMRAEPTADVLGNLLSEFRFDQKGTSFFPTPPEIGRLMASLVGDAPSTSFYEPCCGTGGNAIQWLESRWEARGEEGITEARLMLEDVDPMMVKCCMLQLLHYFEVRCASPAELSILGIDVLTRRPSGIAYHATALPPAPALTSDRCAVERRPASTALSKA